MIEIILGYAVFLFNDFLFYFSSSYEEWLLIDYIGRLIVLILIYSHYKKNQLSLSNLYLNRVAPKIAIYIVVSMTLIGYFLYTGLEPYIYDGGILDFPKPTNQYLFMFDISIGILLVSVSEELFFRSILYTWLPKYKIFLSSFLFGLIHWGSGFNSVFLAFLIGLMFAYSVKKTNSIIPALITHYVLDFLFFVVD